MWDEPTTSSTQNANEDIGSCIQLRCHELINAYSNPCQQHNQHTHFPLILDATHIPFASEDPIDNSLIEDRRGWICRKHSMVFTYRWKWELMDRIAVRLFVRYANVQACYLVCYFHLLLGDAEISPRWTFLMEGMRIENLSEWMETDGWTDEEKERVKEREEREKEEFSLMPPIPIALCDYDTPLFHPSHPSHPSHPHVTHIALNNNRFLQLIVNGLVHVHRFCVLVSFHPARPSIHACPVCSDVCKMHTLSLRVLILNFGVVGERQGGWGAHTDAFKAWWTIGWSMVTFEWVILVYVSIPTLPSFLHLRHRATLPKGSFSMPIPPSLFAFAS